MKRFVFLSLIASAFAASSCGDNADQTDEVVIETTSEVDTASFLANLTELETRINGSTLPAGEDLKEAVVAFQDFASMFPEDPKAPDYLLKASDFSLTDGKPEQSVKILNKIMLEYPAYNRMEDVMYNKASHLDFELRDTTEAKKAYQEFIDKYPNSVLVNDCQSRIENIRYSMEELTEKFLQEMESGENLP